jgi:hypothetical protein
LALQIEDCLKQFVVDEAFSASEGSTGIVDSCGMKTGFSMRGSGKLGANRLDMEILIRRIARILPTLHDNVGSNAHGQQWWRWCMSKASLCAKPDYSKDAEKMVGSPALAPVSFCI